jgi:hypothetical protein
MKVKATLLTLLLFAVLLTGCKNNNNDEGANTSPSPAPTTAATATPGVTTTAAITPTTTPNSGTDVVTTASIVNTQDAFLNAISSNGTWIIAVTQDMTIDQDLVLTGEYKNGKKDDAGNDIIQRKVALYSQDADRNITARYTLTAPKFTIESPMASIQHGTFKGDLYVDVENFALIDATVDGNVYFSKKEFQDTFTMDETSKVTGTQKLQEQ